MNPGPLIIGLASTSLNGAETELLKHPAVGGVIIFSRNFSGPGQLKGLVAAIRAARDGELLIMVDQEGGRVQRLREGFTPLPPLAVLGRWHGQYPDRARDLAYRHGRVMAAEVLETGIDLSLAPVLDLDRGSAVIGDRAMASDPDTVIDLAGWYIAGMADAGMACCAKHFPGHGSVVGDSHDEVVTDCRPFAEIADDLAPFARLANRLSAVMMAHVVQTSRDELPAGYSPVWVREVLRGELGFAGVVISDDLCMSGGASIGDVRARLDAALAAGCDLALVCQAGPAAELVVELGDEWPDCSAAVATLRGSAAFSLEEQLTVPEFRAWRHSLKQLAENR